MSDPLCYQLLGHLLGALDDDEHQRVEARLERDEEGCREWIRWRQRLAPLEAVRPDFEPPAGLAQRTCRFVASCAPIAAGFRAWTAKRHMSPDPAPPCRTDRIGWFDVIVVALLVMTAGAVVLPAIDSSRFEARVASCQDRLRQFGVALRQYCLDQQSELVELASNGRLTRAGVFAASRLRNGELGDDGRGLCPDAWLAAQGALRAFAPAATTSNELQRPTTSVAGVRVTGWEATGPQSRGFLGIDGSNLDWPGTSRNGTREGWRFLPSPAEMPLLADAPSADLPGQDCSSHGGRGRNVLFEDGRVAFLPVATPADVTDRSFLPVETSPARRVFAPIVFVSGR